MKNILLLILLATPLYSNAASIGNNTDHLQQLFIASTENDRQWLLAKAKFSEAQELYPQAKSKLFPSISLTANSNSIQQQITNGLVVGPQQKYPSNSVAFVARQALFNPRATIGLKLASAQFLQAEHNLSFEQQQLYVRLLEIVAQKIDAQYRIKLNAAQIELANEKLNASLLALKNGIGSSLDVERIKSELELSIAQGVQFKNNLFLINSKLNLSVQNEVLVSKFMRIRSFDRNRFILPNLDLLIDSLGLSNSKILAAQYDIDISTHALSQSNSGHLPTLDLIYQNVNSKGENNFFATSTTQSQAVGVQFNLPLYSGGSINSSVRQASEKLLQAEETLKITQNEMKLALIGEYNSIQDNLSLINSLDVAVKYATMSQQAASKGINAGQSSNIDFLTTKYDLMRALADQNSARLKVITSWLRIKLLLNQFDFNALGIFDIVSE